MGTRAWIVLSLAASAWVALAGAASAATTLTPGVKDVSHDAVTVTWGRTQDICFTSYDVQWRAAGATNWATAASIDDSGQTQYRLTGLAPDTAYEVRVVDVDCLGNQPSEPVAFTTTSLLSGGLTDGQLQLIIAAGAISVAVCVVIVLRSRAHRARVESAQVLVALDPGDGRVRKCVRCAAPVATEFCGKCGARQE
jgi:hypothetical protein